MDVSKWKESIDWHEWRNAFKEKDGSEKEEIEVTLTWRNAYPWKPPRMEREKYNLLMSFRTKMKKKNTSLLIFFILTLFHFSPHLTIIIHVYNRRVERVVSSAFQQTSSTRIRCKNRLYQRGFVVETDFFVTDTFSLFEDHLNKKWFFQNDIERRKKVVGSLLIQQQLHHFSSFSKPLSVSFTTISFWIISLSLVFGGKWKCFFGPFNKKYVSTCLQWQKLQSYGIPSFQS